MVNRTQMLVLGFFVLAVLAGVLRVPVAILQLTGELAADGPGWYVSFQGCWASSR